MSVRSNALMTVLRSCTHQFADEIALHTLMAQALDKAAWGYEREVRLSGADRIDFLVDGNIGIEVKIKGRAGEVLSQLTRYAESERIDELILFTTRLQLARMPFDIDGKPLHVLYRPEY